RIDCFGLPWRDSGGIGAPLFLSLNRRLSSNGIAKGSGFIGVGSRKQVGQADRGSMPKFANLSAGSHKRILYGARHGFKPNYIFLDSRWPNQLSPNTESRRPSLPPKRGRLSSPITPGTSLASIFLPSPLRRSVTYTASSSSCTRGVKSSISTSLNIRPPPGRPSN